MAIRQLSVFIENKQGKLSDAVKSISDAGINIRALSIADTKDFGILRLIVADTDKARSIIGDDALVNVTEVIAVKMDDEKGALHKVLDILEEAGINIDYAYAFTGKGDLGAYVVIRVDDVAAAEALLSDKGVTTLSDESAI